MFQQIFCNNICVLVLSGARAYPTKAAAGIVPGGIHPYAAQWLPSREIIHTRQWNNTKGWYKTSSETNLGEQYFYLCRLEIRDPQVRFDVSIDLLFCRGLLPAESNETMWLVSNFSFCSFHSFFYVAGICCRLTHQSVSRPRFQQNPTTG